MATETKVTHTPGTWQCMGTYSTHNSPDRYWETNVTRIDNAIVARACGATEEESKANARLIACAPELLGLAHSYLRYIEATDGHHALKEIVQAAIAKAAGK